MKVTRQMTDKCSIPDCEKPIKHKNLCGMHYKCNWRHGHPLIKLISDTGLLCSEDGCSKPNNGKGFCKIHRQRLRRYGRLHNIVASKGEGRPKTGSGYVLLTVNGKRIYEHIHVAEKALGKKLPIKAVVHHMNNKPYDNFTPFNLIICPDQAYHLLLHKRMQEYDQYGKCWSI